MEYKEMAFWFVLVFSVIFVSLYHQQINETITDFPGEILPYNGEIHNPVRISYVTYYFGPRIDPISDKLSDHNGIDLASWEGMAVYAVKDGNVVKMENSPDGFGNYVMLQHQDGTFTIYAHLSTFGNIKLEDHVGSGSVIGAIGSTGRSTGPHLHFELHDKDGNPQDSLELLNKGSIWSRLFFQKVEEQELIQN